MMLRKRHNMRRSIQILWATLLWVPVMFLVAQSINAPLVARSNEPAKPIKTWVGQRQLVWRRLRR